VLDSTEVLSSSIIDEQEEEKKKKKKRMKYSSGFFNAFWLVQFLSHITQNM